MAIEVSVVIPTHSPNPYFLSKILESLAQQAAVSRSSYEVLLVENPEGTKACKRLAKQHGVKHLVCEDIGANNARNYGTFHARGHIIALLDDDVVPCRSWISRILGIHGFYPEVGIVGGKLALEFVRSKPRWIAGIFRHWLSEVDWGLKEFTDIAGDGYKHIVSGNMTYRKGRWEQSGGFPAWAGLKGRDVLTVNDEVEFIRKCGELGYPKVGCDPNMLANHLVPPDRACIEYLNKRAYGQGYADARDWVRMAYLTKSTTEIFYEHVQHRAINFFDPSQIGHIREQIAHEESTRVYIQNLIICKTAYMQGTVDAIERDSGEIWAQVEKEEAAKPKPKSDAGDEPAPVRIVEYEQQQEWDIQEFPTELHKLAVLTCHFNPCKFARPRQNFDRFVDGLNPHLDDLFVCELVFDDDEYDLPDDLVDLKVRGNRERNLVWQKEQLLNLLIQNLPEEYDAVAWFDCDILFTRVDWYEAILETLSKYKVCQCYERAYWMDENGRYTLSQTSVAYNYRFNRPEHSHLAKSHPGYAWAGRADWLRKHGLYAHNITGGGDSLMLTGYSNDAVNLWRMFNKPWAEHVMKWQTAVHEEVQGSLGCTPTEIVHLFHGYKKDRQYIDRWYWMADAGFDPDRDLVIDENGLLAWSDYAIENLQHLVQQVANYFPKRKEDG